MINSNLLTAWAKVMDERWKLNLGSNLVVEVPYREMLAMWEFVSLTCGTGFAHALEHKTELGIRGPVRLYFPSGYLEFREAAKKEGL